MSHRLRQVGLIAMIAALAAAIFFSLQGDGRNGYWATHPMLGALVSGTLLLAAGVLVIQRVVERRNLRRWAAISVAAHRDLGHALEAALTALWGAHSDPDPHTKQRAQQDWTPASRMKGPPPGRDQLSVFATGLAGTDFRGASLTPSARLGQLLADPAFVGFARDLVDHHRDILRGAAKDWAGLMMWSTPSQELLNALGLYAEKHLSRLAYHLYCNPESSEKHRHEAVEQWILADVKGRVLLNTLWGTNTSYRFALPDGASGVPLMAAFRYQDTVGRWRPWPYSDLSRRDHIIRQGRWLWRQLIGR